MEEVTPPIQACLANAEKLIEAAGVSSKPGSYHIAYHLAALALEEIGKSSMVFMSAINPRPTEEGDRLGPSNGSTIMSTSCFGPSGCHVA
jgi:hypothetical protein